MDNSIKFRTHEGVIVSDDKLKSALNIVADNMIDSAKNIREEDAYANHVSEEQKDQAMEDYIDYAEQVREGHNLQNFTIWQRVNSVLTGECIAFLP